MFTATANNPNCATTHDLTLVLRRSYLQFRMNTSCAAFSPVNTSRRIFVDKTRLKQGSYALNVLDWLRVWPLYLYEIAG